MMAAGAEVVSVALLMAGSLVVLAAMIGLVRLPDVFCRAHAVGKGMTLGLSLLLLGLWVKLGTTEVGWRIVAVIAFLFVTLPVSSHLVARVALEKRLPRAGRDWRETSSEADGAGSAPAPGPEERR